MRAVIWTVAGFLLACSVVNAEKKVVCYYRSWSVFRPGNGFFEPSLIDPTLCTHLIYAFIGLTDDGVVKILDPQVDISEDGGKDDLNHFIQLREKNPDCKFLIGLGGSNEDSAKYSAVVADPEKRKNLAESAIQFLKLFNFDGLDFDWEYPNQRGGVEEDKENFVLALKELRDAFQKENYILTASVSASELSASLSYNIPDVTTYVDFVNLKTFDFHGPWNNKTGMNAPLYADIKEEGEERLLNVNASVQYWLAQGAPPEKIVMGVPFYGRTYTLSNSTLIKIGAEIKSGGNPGPYTNEPGYLGYNEICEMQKDGTWEGYYKSTQEVPVNIKGDQWISYDSPWSINKKAEYINTHDLGGAMAWAIDTDDFSGRCGAKFRLLLVLNQRLRGKA